jgi:hypothetical protein
MNCTALRFYKDVPKHGHSPQKLKTIEKSNCDDYSKNRRYPHLAKHKDNRKSYYSPFTFELEPKDDNETHKRIIWP